MILPLTSHYEYLFLLGRPDLHQRMKRLDTLHRNTPVHKEDKIPDFYELCKTSPLPEITHQRGGVPDPTPVFTHPAMNHVYPQAIPFASSNFGGNPNQFSISNDQVLSLLGNDAARPEAAHLAQLKADNEDLKRCIAAM